ncbi:MAG: zinc ribbon domain-containing protein [Planctomycetes bacterium]|nr:zinc ribbon domain-containing protein [Planctomycetota bacterium]
MPTYDYECGACGNVFEVFERIHADGAKPCPKCGKKRAKRRITPPAGLIFKGSGFYVTDSKGAPAPSDGHKKKTEHKATGKTETKSDKTEKK